LQLSLHHVILIGSAASGKGLVNVYKGTGKVLMAPVLQQKIGFIIKNKLTYI